ncbi:MAG: helix-turn-helix domain-containing protein [Armatimonadota bacterium]|nr:helix-turn-helix domain-containing protein [Armatimonadota bacterium]
MSVLVLSRVFGASSSLGGDRLVLLALADSASDDGITWISQARLACKAGMSERGVRKRLASLVALGEVEVRRAQRGRARINVYRVLLPGLAAPRYEDLPFELSEPFSPGLPEQSLSLPEETKTEALTTGTTCRSSEGDDRNAGSGREQGTPYLDHRTRYRSSAHGDHRNNVPVVAAGERSEKTKARPHPKAPAIVHLPLAEGRLRAIASYGSSRQDKVPEALRCIRDHYLAELAEAGEPPPLDPAHLDRRLAEEIEVRAEMYRDAMDRGLLTPKALCEWWRDLPTIERLQGRRRGMRAADVVRLLGPLEEGPPSWAGRQAVGEPGPALGAASDA